MHFLINSEIGQSKINYHSELYIALKTGSKTPNSFSENGIVYINTTLNDNRAITELQNTLLVGDRNTEYE